MTDHPKTFADLGLREEILAAVAEAGYTAPTPIQAQAIPRILERRDVVGVAQTGPGKTAPLTLPMLQILAAGRTRARMPRSLILSPTRELATQTARNFELYGKNLKLTMALLIGGVGMGEQERALEKGVDVLIATPGRLLDWFERGKVLLGGVEILVIDEADRMLDMGFIPDVRRIIGRIPDREQRQTLLFSATITDDVRRLADQWCVDPVSVETEVEQVAVETVEQIVYMTTSEEKYHVLYNLITGREHERIIVFANMKNQARRLYERLRGNGIDCALLTGDVPQDKRMARLERFRDGRVRVLIATDVAGRGIHIEGISHVVNYTLPYEPEDYVHRIGRTGRAGNSGISISFADEEDGFVLPVIEEFIEQPLTCVQPDEDLLKPAPPVRERPRSKQRSGRRRKRRR